MVKRMCTCRKRPRKRKGKKRKQNRKRQKGKGIFSAFEPLIGNLLGNLF